MRNLFALFCLFFSLTIGAQDYHIQHIGIEKGLSNSYVCSMVQDKHGRIWIATEGGLSRFDGSRFTVYLTSNSDLPNDLLNAVFYDEAGDKIWVASKKEGLCTIACSTGRFHVYTSKDITNIHCIVHFAQSAQGGIWLASYNEHIVHYDRRTQRFTQLAGGEIDSIPKKFRRLLDDGKGRLYVGHAMDGMSVIDLKTKKVKRFVHRKDTPGSIPGNNVLCIYQDRAKRIWVGTEQGVGLFDERNETFIHFKHEADNPHSLVADHTYDILETSDGMLWIASDIGGISILDLNELAFRGPSGVRFRHITAEGKGGEYLSSRNIRNLLQDAYGNIWIGNYGRGLDFIGHSLPMFQILSYHYRIEKMGRQDEMPAYGLCWGKDNCLWVGGENELVSFKDGVLQKRVDLRAYLSRPNGQVLSIMEAEDGQLLLGIYDDGVLKYDTHTKRIERIPLGRNYVDILSFRKDTNGKIWICTEYGLYSYQDGKARYESELMAYMKGMSIYDLVRDRQGKLWVGTYGDGVYIFDNKEEFVLHLNGAGDFSGGITDLYADDAGGIWIATKDGMAYVPDSAHPETYEAYGMAEGLADTYIRSVHTDLSGHAWVSTNQGISRLNRSTRRFENFDYHDGTPLGNFVDGSSCRASDGTLYFGSLRGVCYFQPERLEETRQVAPVRILECRLLEGQTDENGSTPTLLPMKEGKISIPYDNNSFNISFSVSDYAQHGQVEYAYRVDGLTREWTHTQGEEQVSFRNLAPGDYHFQVKARLRNQDWDEGSIATLRVQVLPPLWQTWYAKTFYAALFLWALWLGFRFYRRRLMWKASLEVERKNSLAKQELNEERLRFYTNITHELRTPLTLILGPLDDLTRDKQMPANYGRKIRLIRDSAQRLLDLVNQILDFRKTETQNRKLVVQRGELGSLLTEIGLRYKELNRNPQVKFDIRIENGGERLYFDPEIVSTVINNLLSNACKYTPEGTITLTLQWSGTGEKHMAEIAVADTGYGIEPEALPHIFDRYYQAEGKHQASGTGIGLALVKGLADLHQAQLDVESQPGKGSRFTFRLQADNTYPNSLHKESETLQPALPIENEGSPATEPGAGTQERPLLLIVEDNDDIRNYIAGSFEDNYHILTATNGREGMEQALTTVPDIIISDVMMPVMDGIELCRILKTDIRTSHIPIILLTAKDRIEDKEEGYETGADSYLTKPFSARLLKIRVKNLLEIRRQMARQIALEVHGLKPVKAETELPMNRLDTEFINKLTQYVEKNIESEKMDMGLLAEQMHMSHSTLYRKIKSLTGMTGNEFIRKLRLKNSLRLLTAGDCNVSEAAYASGFNDLGYFRSCFKEEYGTLPSEYLKQKGKNENTAE